MIPYGKQCIEEDDIQEVLKVLKSDWVTQGPKIKEFEDAICAYTGARHAIAVATGTAALHCACFAAGIGPGDEVITAPITFAASGNCALFLGADVKFVDIRKDTYCMDPKKLESAITPKTKAIIPVDFTGQPCDMDEINNIAKKHNLIVIHDAAHSLGASYKGKKIGTLANMTIFSFHPVKHITTGEGGMIVTSDELLAKKLRLFRTHGITNDSSSIKLKEQASDNENSFLKGRNPETVSPWYYEMQALGYNYRITDIQCALGLSQLKKLDQFISKRRKIVARYTEAFSKSPYLITPLQENDRKNAWHLYMLCLRLKEMIKTRRQVFEELRALGIGVHVHYMPLHLQPYYRERFGYKREDFPEAEKFYDRAITIPLFPGLTDSEVEYIIENVLKVVK
ncbi:UDP-4-amino-4,6-dideoxy-N-acetyl-beta-L-altrosamine transaminase [Candidatus Omnitrophota bacterium]